MWINLLGYHECRHWKYPYTFFHKPQFSADTAKEKRLFTHNIPGKPWEVIETDMFSLYDKHYLGLIDYHSKLPVIKRTDIFSALSVILICKIVFAEYRLPMKISSDTCGNSFQEKFIKFYTTQFIVQTVLSSYYHKSNGQIEPCIKFITCTLEKYFDTNADVHSALLQIRSTTLWHGLLFNCPITVIMPVMCRSSKMLAMMITIIEHQWKDKPKLIRLWYSQKSCFSSHGVSCGGSVRGHKTTDPCNNSWKGWP